MQAIYEHWKGITNYPNYEVSNLGNVRHTKTKRNLKPFTDRLQEYPRVTLFNEEGHHKFMVHILVAHAFLGTKPEGAEIDHLNSNRFDNRACNLAYVSAEENRNNPITKFNQQVSRIRKAIKSGRKSQEEIAQLIRSMERF